MFSTVEFAAGGEDDLFTRPLMPIEILGLRQQKGRPEGRPIQMSAD
jgi:hypothetical protein